MTTLSTTFTASPSGISGGTGVGIPGKIQRNGVGPVETNPHALQYGVPLDNGATATNQRQKITVDFKVDAGYTGHFGVIGKHMMKTYKFAGDNRALGFIGGNWHLPADPTKSGTNAFGVEEIEATAGFGNYHPSTLSNVLVPNTWYRVAVDISRVANGSQCVAVRVWNKSTGVLVYSTADLWSPHAAVYPAGAGSVTVFNIPGGTGNVTFSNLANVWGPTSSWVPNP